MSLTRGRSEVGASEPAECCTRLSTLSPTRDQGNGEGVASCAEEGKGPRAERGTWGRGGGVGDGRKNKERNTRCRHRNLSMGEEPEPPNRELTQKRQSAAGSWRVGFTPATAGVPEQGHMTTEDPRWRDKKVQG